MSILLSIASGAIFGALGRHYLIQIISRWLGGNFPWGTLTVNILGCLLMGLLIESFALHGSTTPETRAFLTVGMLGAFTTFSAFSLDTILLIEKGELVSASIYVLASVILSILGLFTGMMLVKAVF